MSPKHSFSKPQERTYEMRFVYWSKNTRDVRRLMKALSIKVLTLKEISPDKESG